jgi:hypothetical protein
MVSPQLNNRLGFINPGLTKIYHLKIWISQQLIRLMRLASRTFGQRFLAPSATKFEMTKRDKEIHSETGTCFKQQSVY